ncbi:MAG TPA: selenocysteine-specific translation elongation factor [Terriglobales bacterium]|jgi:selenocysteine-specific elongation factor|nr:selenocysteine-specific translation elongation factor [Terriglobales bacterium]
MKSVIVGTAGHIDHGKTRLVKALTGIDADRLGEEKRRGITIDIGFAHLELPAPNGEKLELGFIDVPGHERFVRNMLAGVGGIDLVLFVVAANESIRPQTREHFDICRLLSLPRGITVLTKSDLVDSDTLKVVRAELQDFLRGSFLDPSTSPIIAVNSREGAGLEELKRALAGVAAEIPAKNPEAYFRLPVDRAFTMKGFGTVVTGTMISGSIGKDAEVEILPQKLRARVRGVQVHGVACEKAVAGERTALNLTGPGVSTEALARGMVIVEPGLFAPTRIVDVRLSLLRSAKPLQDRSRVHFYAHTSEAIADVLLHGRKQLAPGEDAYAQLRLSGSTLLMPGDRFIVRQFSPVVTIGGGIVLDSSPIRLKPEPHLRFLETLASGSPEQVLEARIARQNGNGLDAARAVAETGWLAKTVEAIAAKLVAQGKIARAGNVFIAISALSDLQERAFAEIENFQQQNPLVAGYSKEALRERLGVHSEILECVLADLVRLKKVEASGEHVRTAGRGVVMKDEEIESKQIIEQAFAQAGLKVPALKEILAGLKIDKGRAQRLVTLLLREKTLVKLGDDLVFHHDALRRLRQSLLEQKSKSQKIDVAKFKDLTGVSRKYAIPLLEYLDREHITRREGDVRIIL